MHSFHTETAREDFCWNFK